MKLKIKKRLSKAFKYLSLSWGCKEDLALKKSFSDHSLKQINSKKDFQKEVKNEQSGNNHNDNTYEKKCDSEEHTEDLA